MPLIKLNKKYTVTRRPKIDVNNMSVGKTRDEWTKIIIYPDKKFLDQFKGVKVAADLSDDLTAIFIRKPRPDDEKRRLYKIRPETASKAAQIHLPVGGIYEDENGDQFELTINTKYMYERSICSARYDEIHKKWIFPIIETIQIQKKPVTNVVPFKISEDTPCL
jgi:hypothetical protein